MGARSLRTYVLLKNAANVGLCFEHPPWWDVSRLVAPLPHRRVTLSPDDRSAWLLSWAHLLTWSKQQGQWVENVPYMKAPCEASSQERRGVLRALRQAEWLVIDQERVWVIPKEPGEACRIFEGPSWWSALAAEHLDLLSQRRIDVNNPLWVDYVYLFTPEEALTIDAAARERWKAYCREVYSRKLTRHEISEMARFKQALQQAVWVTLYDYEWESGLA
ncbi:MAG: hypothetical protein GXP42_16790 [Chloroflexi bacterium]|nr:hypothetical protein [Chloroflexota bacterium]